MSRFKLALMSSPKDCCSQPKADDLYVARGVLYVQLAQYDKAEADFEKAYELNPNQSLSTAAQGLAAVQANDLDHALASIQEKLANANRTTRSCSICRRMCYRKRVRIPVHLSFNSPCVRRRKRWPCSPLSRLPVPSWLSCTCNPDIIRQAIDQCRKALAIDPKDQTAVYRLIQALRKTGQKKEIPELLQRLAQASGTGHRRGTRALPLQTFCGRTHRKTTSSHNSPSRCLVIFPGY